MWNAGLLLRPLKHRPEAGAAGHQLVDEPHARRLAFELPALAEQVIGRELLERRTGYLPSPSVRFASFGHDHG